MLWFKKYHNKLYVSNPMAKTSNYATGLQLNFPE